MMEWMRTAGFAATFVVAVSTPAMAECLQGDLGVSSRYGSGWLDLRQPIDLAAGDQLDLLVGGAAKRILVRLLPQGGDPSIPVGLVGPPIDVPVDKLVSVTLGSDRAAVVQISVHGGSKPFGISLDGDNGPATLLQVSRNGC